MIREKHWSLLRKWTCTDINENKLIPHNFKKKINFEKWVLPVVREIIRCSLILFPHFVIVLNLLLFKYCLILLLFTKHYILDSSTLKAVNHAVGTLLVIFILLGRLIVCWNLSIILSECFQEEKKISMIISERNDKIYSNKDNDRKTLLEPV